MRINELIQEFTIQTSNEEKDMLSKITERKKFRYFYGKRSGSNKSISKKKFGPQNR